MRNCGSCDVLDRGLCASPPRRPSSASPSRTAPPPPPPDSPGGDGRMLCLACLGDASPRKARRGLGIPVCMHCHRPVTASPGDDEPRSPGGPERLHFPTGSIWEIIKSSAHHKIQTEAVRIISEHTTPCGKTLGVVAHYAERYGPHWHCITGSHKTAWRLWYDEPSMLWLESPNQRLALFRRKPVSKIIEAPTEEMTDKFAKICAKTQKKWSKKATVQRPLVVRDELIRKFGGWWNVVVGRTDEFVITSVNDYRPVEMIISVDHYTYYAWLG